MTFSEYTSYFEAIIKKTPAEQTAPYDNPEYIDYTRLNWSRMNRWLKTTELMPQLKQAVQHVKSPQQWILITEPWCGDAAHSVPFVELASRENKLIQLIWELRDQPPFRINEYLTNNGKAIPKLIIRDEQQNDLGIWGPRPAACQTLYQTLITEHADFERIKTELQHWYNANKGQDIQTELTTLLNNITTSNGQ